MQAAPAMAGGLEKGRHSVNWCARAASLSSLSVLPLCPASLSCALWAFEKINTQSPN